MNHISNSIFKNGQSDKNNLIFHDSVYGHIRVSPLACAIIDTKEFQRLRRIKQLSMGTLVFPCAEHTRFSHSLGSYHVMTLITERLRENLPKTQSEVAQKKQDLYLEALDIAALLHDVGHGPYSHSFEQIIAHSPNKLESHEDWTRKIIENESTEIHEILQNYSVSQGEDKDFFQNLVLSYLCKDLDLISKTTKSENAYMNLYQAFSSLISSNLDADRLDYLQRDALFSGAVYGKFDLESIINGLRIIYNKKEPPVIAVEEAKTADLEGYLFLRSQMYKNVYYKRQKVFAEDLLVRIFHYAQELFYCEILSLNEIPPAVRCLFVDVKIKIKDYCNLDDYIILGTIREWSTFIDKPGLQDLATMCLLLLERRGYVVVNVGKNDHLSDIIKGILCDAIKSKKGTKVLVETKNERDSLSEGIFPFWIYKSIKTNLFDNSPIYIVQANSLLSTLADKSYIIRTLENEVYEDYFAYWSEDVCIAYLEGLFPDSRDREFREELLKKIKKVIALQSTSEQCEYERKYRFTNKSELEKYARFLENYFTSSQYSKSEHIEEYTDTFFDTSDRQFYNQNIEIRIRNSNANKAVKLIIKTPSASNSCRQELSGRTKSQKVVNKKEGLASEQYIGDIIKQLAENGIPWTGKKNFIVLSEIRTKRSQTVWNNSQTDTSFTINRDVIESATGVGYLLELKFHTEAYNNLPLIDLIMAIKNEFPNAESLIIEESKLQMEMKQSGSKTV